MRLVSLLLFVAATFAAGLWIGRSSAAPEPQGEPTWIVAGELSRTRAYARAVALETGEILILGGLDATDEHVTIPTTEVFDPKTHRSTVLAQKILGRLNQTATVAWGGRVIVAGGTEWMGDGWNSVANVDVYLPWPKQWQHASPMLDARSDHGAAALTDGRVFVTGGNYNTHVLRSSEIYDPRSDAWTPARPMPRGRTQFSMATLPDGSVLVAGGFEEDGKMTTSTLIYEPSSDRWITGPQLREPRLNHAMVQLSSGDVLFFGGEKGGAGTAERYSWRDRAFVYAGVLGEPRLVAQGAQLPDGRVVAVGGLPDDRARTHFAPTTNAELWDPAKAVWSDIAGAPTKRAYAQLVATERGIFRVSGVGEDESPFATVEELTWHH